jgi:cytidyltransferase-like protein
MVHYLLKNGGNMAKLISINELKKIKKNFKNKKIGLCHGAFDVLHNGHLSHFQEARKKVDILIVSVTADKFIFKGPSQPYNNEIDRTKFLLHINSIDYVYLDNNLTAEKIIKELRPDLYFKGKDYLQKDITGNLKKELDTLKKNKGKIFITKTPLLSSTKIINNYFKPFTNKTEKYLKKISKEDTFNEINNSLKKLEKLEFNIIGDPIVDKYIQCEMSGLTTKDPAISTIIKKIETIPGGVLAVAKILSKFVKKVNLYTYGNKKNIKKYFIKEKNINIINLDISQPVQTKTRYINSTRFEKLLQVTNFKKSVFSKITIDKINKKIKKIKNSLMICDFGNGLFENEVLKTINQIKVYKYINVQTNSINYGYNLYTKYENKFNYLSLDEREWKLALRKNNLSDLGKILKLNKNISCSLTKGKKGSEFFWKNKKENCPVFIEKTIDTTGCGDAYFAITSIMLTANLKHYLIPFVGNVYAGMHSQFFGNSNIINKTNFLKYIKSLLNR